MIYNPFYEIITEDRTISRIALEVLYELVNKNLIMASYVYNDAVEIFNIGINSYNDIAYDLYELGK